MTRSTRASSRAKPSFEAGFAAAIAQLVRMGHIDFVEVQDVLDGSGYTADALKAAGADEYDLSEIRRVFPS